MLDRFLQRCLLQEPSPRYDPTISEHGWGFRPKRSAHDVVRAAGDAMATLQRRFARLRHEVNGSRSAVAKVWERTFLGYSFQVAAGQVVRYRVAPAALAEMRDRVRTITSRTGGRSMERVTQGLRSCLAGWRNYFRFAETPRGFRDLDEWLRHRIRTRMSGGVGGGYWDEPAIPHPNRGCEARACGPRGRPRPSHAAANLRAS